MPKLRILLHSLALGLGVLATAQGGLPEGPGADLVYAKCQSCHSLSYVTDSAGIPAFLWEETVEQMQAFGLELTAEEHERILDYLTTYLGPNPPPASKGEGAQSAEGQDQSQQGEPQEVQEISGEALYNTNCAGCHQQDGQGVAGRFPPLTNQAPALYGAEGGREYLINVLLYGLQGEIQVQGETYNGVMPSWGQLDDAEIAALLNHILTAWENEEALPESFTSYSADDIAAQRGAALSPQEVHEGRPEVQSGE